MNGLKNMVRGNQYICGRTVGNLVRTHQHLYIFKTLFSKDKFNGLFLAALGDLAQDEN
jgi:hypothetical protein